MTALPWVRDDGGRAAAGRRGDAGDCVVRAIAIASGRPYADVYRELGDRMAAAGHGRRIASEGIYRRIYGAYLEGELGATWTATMQIGSGCRVHLAAGELPAGRLVARLSGHIAAVLEGVVHDTYDPGRGGTRCVYGFWTMPA